MEVTPIEKQVVYGFYTIGGWWRNGRPLNHPGYEYPHYQPALEEFEWFDSNKNAFPVLYGWNKDEPTELKTSEK